MSRGLGSWGITNCRREITIKKYLGLSTYLMDESIAMSTYWYCTFASRISKQADALKMWEVWTLQLPATIQDSPLYASYIQYNCNSINFPRYKLRQKNKQTKKDCGLRSITNLDLESIFRSPLMLIWSCYILSYTTAVYQIIPWE